MIVFGRRVFWRTFSWWLGRVALLSLTLGRVAFTQARSRSNGNVFRSCHLSSPTPPTSNTSPENRWAFAKSASLRPTWPWAAVPYVGFRVRCLFVAAVRLHTRRKSDEELFGEMSGCLRKHKARYCDVGVVCLLHLGCVWVVNLLLTWWERFFFIFHFSFSLWDGPWKFTTIFC